MTLYYLDRQIKSSNVHDDLFFIVYAILHDCYCCYRSKNPNKNDNFEDTVHKTLKIPAKWKCRQSKEQEVTVDAEEITISKSISHRAKIHFKPHGNFLMYKIMNKINTL